MDTSPTPAQPRTLSTDVCVVGGGPAGLMAGYLLARQGIEVTVLEKHPDFHRDFRGDTIHPSTLELLGELGLLDDFLALPHDEMRRAQVSFGSTRRTVADLSRLPTRCRFMVFVPQWDFLDFLARTAEALPTFTLLRETEVTGLMTSALPEDADSGGTNDRRGPGRRDQGRRREPGRTAGQRVTGVRARSARDASPLEIHARLVLGADGRSSLLRAAAGLPLRTTGAPIDVLWMRIPRREDEDLPLFTGGAGVLVLIDRGEYWQAAFAVPHGTIERIHERGIGFLHRRLALARPELEDRLDSLTWDDVHPLAVRVDHLTRWHVPGLLCIGDAAHAMSPVGGVGINLAIQDAVAAARILGPILAPATRRTPTSRELDAVRRRRLWPALLTQRIQAGVASGAFPRTLDDVATGEPLVLRLVDALPFLRHVTGRFIGVGVRPEHAVGLDGQERRPR